MRIKTLFRAFVQVPGNLLRNVPEQELLDYTELYNALDKFGEQARFAALNRQARLREVTLVELFGSGIEQVEVPYGCINEYTGKQNQAELFIVNTIARHVKADAIFEFGTFTGRTTYFLTFSSANTSVVTLDLPPDTSGRYIENVGYYFKGTGRDDRIKQIFMDSKKFDPAPYKKSMDLIFIDGDHSYEGVKNDTEKALEMLKPGGIILWHDYGASNDLGLVKFFVEFTQKTPLFRLKKTSLLMYLDGVESMTFQTHQASHAAWIAK